MARSTIEAIRTGEMNTGDEITVSYTDNSGRAQTEEGVVTEIELCEKGDERGTGKWSWEITATFARIEYEVEGKNDHTAIVYEDPDSVNTNEVKTAVSGSSSNGGDSRRVGVLDGIEIEDDGEDDVEDGATGAFCMHCKTFVDSFVCVSVIGSRTGASGCPHCLEASGIRKVVHEVGDDRTVTGGYVPTLQREHGSSITLDAALAIADVEVVADGGSDDHEDDDDLDTPVEFHSAGADAGDVLDALDVLEPGDRVLWSDRKIPLTVAHVTTEIDDRVGRTLTASVITTDPRDYNEESDLRRGDVFLNPSSRYGLSACRRFALIQGPRGGFYAIAEAKKNGRSMPALFRAVRSYHQTRLGHAGQGAWNFEQWFDDALTLVERGESPEVIDEGGDLPSYETYKDHRLVSYDRDAEEHYVVSETLADAFDEGLLDAHSRASAEFSRELDEIDEDPFSDVPRSDEVENTSVENHSTVTVTDVVDAPDGPIALLDGPAPWETPDGETPLNEVLKSTPYSETKRRWDPDREAWTVKAETLRAIAIVLDDHGYDLRAEYEVEPDGGRVILTDGGVIESFDRDENVLDPEDVVPGQVYRSHLGERIEIVHGDGPSTRPLLVAFPEREATANEAYMTTASFASMATFDGFDLVELNADTVSGEFVETPRCPSCGAFSEGSYDDAGFPIAFCRSPVCDAHPLDVDELIDGGYYEP